MRFAAICMTAAALVSTNARADEGMRILATSGPWAAMAHAESMLAAPDVCLATTLEGKIAFRADDTQVEFRVIDEAWSLPANVSGKIVVKVGPQTWTLDITDNTSTIVTAEMTKPDMAKLLGAMDSASSMNVTPGAAKTRLISLAGSTKATNAFRTCAKISGSAPSGGANPFDTKPN